jgi:hypothetical protein
VTINALIIMAHVLVLENANALRENLELTAKIVSRYFGDIKQDYDMEDSTINK